MEINTAVEAETPDIVFLDKTSEAVRSFVRPVSRIINTAAVSVLALMMFLTVADVILRYMFNSPIMGTIEITEFMMVISVALGFAYTWLSKGLIDVDIVVMRLRPRAQDVIRTVTFFLCVATFALITWWSIIYAEKLRTGNITSPTLYIPVYPFVYIAALGSIMLCLVLFISFVDHLNRAFKGTRWQFQLKLALGIIAILVLLATPIWGRELLAGQISPFMAGVWGVVLLIIILFSSMPIGIAMAVVSLLGMVYVNSLVAGLAFMATTYYGTVSSYNLSTLPMFTLMGEFCFYSGLSTDLYYTVYRWVGHLRGGLAIATVGACAGFAAVSGSSVATAVTMGTVALPEMKKYKYNSALATGCIAAGGTLGILIPPSVPLVIYGILTEQSIGKLLLAGFIPGILQAVFYMVNIYIICKLNPLAGPPGPSATFTERLIALKDTWGVVALFMLVIGGIYAGVFTAIEAAGVGAFGALLFALLKRRINLKNFHASLLETVKTSCMAMLFLIGGMLFGYFLAVTRLPFQLSDMIVGMEVSRYVVLGAIILIYLFLGCIMSSLAMLIITVPIFFPIINTLGFDGIWFGIIVVRMMEMGQITPPVGLNVFVIQGIARDVPMYTVFRGILSFFIADLFHVALLVAVPEIALLLPHMMK